MAHKETTSTHPYKPLLRKVLKWSLRLAALGLILILLLIGSVWAGLFGPLPDYQELNNLTQAKASVVYSADKVVLGKYYLQDRNPLRYDDISPALIHALVATEDARFFEHDGVDYRSLGRVLVKSVILQQNAGGGSTLSMQLAKNIYPRESHGMLTMPVNKIKEVFTAKKLESLYSKEQILEAYLNTVPFGESAFGVESASQRFFSKSAADLEVHEAALLVGLLKATSWYNPVRHPERAITRRNVVLGQMHKYGYLTAEDLAEAKAQHLALQYQKLDAHDGPAPYLRDQVAKQVKEVLADLEKEDGSPYHLNKDGLRIYTTIDSRLQAIAEEAVDQNTIKLQRAFVDAWGREDPLAGAEALVERLTKKSPHYRSYKAQGYDEAAIDSLMQIKTEQEVYAAGRLQVLNLSPVDSIRFYLKRLHTGFVALDPDNGAVRVWVGGVNHRFMPYDRVGYHMKRQAGSTFKPIVYAAALEAGISPCDYIQAEQVSYNDKDGAWSPGNSDGEYEGKYSMEGALANSVNTVSVKVLERTGIAPTIDLAHSLGIEKDIPEVPSIALGTPQVSPLEMATVYCAFANGGYRVDPWFVQRIEDAEGRLLWEYEPERKTPAIREATADMILHMMKSVANEGTARSLRSVYGLRNDLAGKTGTTQSNADGWFMGVMPGLVTATWVGADYPVVHFRTTAEGQGARSALPVFARFVQGINNDSGLRTDYSGRLRSPSEETLRNLDCDMFKEDIGFWTWLFGKKKKEEDPETRDFGEDEQEEKKPGLFKRIFGGKKNKKNG